MKIPTPEIIAQAKSLNYYVEHLIDPDDPETENIMLSWGDLQSKYDFCDKIFEENGHFGLKDAEGNIRVPALYYDFEEFYDLFSYRDCPVAAINDDRRAALVTVDGTGTPLCDFIYDHIAMLYGTPYYLTILRHKFGLMTSRGDVLLPNEYDCIEEPVNGIFPLRQGTKYGFFCEDGRGFTVPCIYDDIDERNNLVYATLGDRHGYFDTEGHFIDEDQLSDPASAHLLHFYGQEQ